MFSEDESVSRKDKGYFQNIQTFFHSLFQNVEKSSKSFQSIFKSPLFLFFLKRVAKWWTELTASSFHTGK